MTPVLMLIPTGEYHDFGDKPRVQPVWLLTVSKEAYAAMVSPRTRNRRVKEGE